VLFQNQLRHALARIGRTPLSTLFTRRPHANVVEEVALAAVSLAGKRLGALVVLERELGLRAFSETGITLDAEVSYDLLVSIFQRGAPLHDGAVIVVGARIRAACAYLPLTQNPNLSRRFGTRHRAAIGITETLWICLIVMWASWVAILALPAVWAIRRGGGTPAATAA